MKYTKEALFMDMSSDSNDVHAPLPSVKVTYYPGHFLISMDPDYENEILPALFVADYKNLNLTG